MRNVFADHPPARRVTVRGLLCAMVALLAVGVSSASATVSVSTWWGTPSWSVVSIGSSNPFGGTGFERNAGDNRYTYKVANTKTLSEGQTLVCRVGEWQGTPTGFSRQWLRNGVAIAGATSGTYTLVSTDKGTVIQCEVAATGSGGMGGVVATALSVIPPVPSPAPPTSATPTVSGTLTAGQALTCNTGTWGGAPTFAFKWLRNGVPIVGAETNKYTLQGADTSTIVQCQVTGTNAGGAAVRFSASKIITPGRPSWTAVPAISGTVTVGNELTCGNGTWSGSPTFAYQWLRGGSEISGATASKHTIVAEDAGKALQCVVTATNAEGVGSAVSANSVVPTAPSPLPPTPGNPSIAGVRVVGGKVLCSVGAWGNAPTTYTYQWLRNGAPIAGASFGPTTQASFGYTVVAADLGKTLQCETTATNAGGSAVGISVVGTSVTNPPLELSSLPLGGETANLGDKLYCGEGTWTENTTEYNYQWLRNGAPIAGATGKEYTLVAADAGTAVQCRVVAGNSTPDRVLSVSTSLLVSSAPAVTPPVLAVAPTLSVVEEAAIEEGKELSCAAGVWSGSPTIARQWMRNGTAIPGATGETYKLGGSAGNNGQDAGKAIQCQISASNAGGAGLAYTTPDGVSPAPTSPKIPSATAEPNIGTVTTVTDVLPAGMTLGHPPANYEAALPSPIVGPAGWVCAAATVKCTRTEPMLLGESASFTLAVRASSATPDPANNEVVVSGGGAPSAKLVYSNSITETMPFGFESFWTSINEELGTPFGQSVGHPFSATAQFVFNSTTNEEGKMVTSGGDAKNIEVLLPPGFIGSPELAPACPINQFENTGEGCPAASSVGYIWVAVSTAAGVKIVGGKRGIPNFSESGFAAGVIYNLVPPPGSPAAFGFHVSASAFYLTANVRSDGDYGVTVTSANTPSNPELMGAEITFCANGVSDKFGLFGYVKFEFACKAASPNSNSFVQNPAKCTGAAPQTTARMNSWEHPDQVASVTAYTGRNLVGGAPSASESFVTGCENVSFEPSIEPVPLTTQADQGTGVSVFLDVPQQFKVKDGVGSRLTCLKGNWEGSPTGFSYQWLVGGVEVPGATSQTYTLAAGDVGKSVQCLVRAANAGATSATFGTLSETVNGVTSPVTVPPAPATALPAPPVGGIAAPSGGSIFGVNVGDTLTCNAGAWTGAPSLEYQWLRNGSPIAGATSSTYVVQAADSKTNVQCEVVGTNAGGLVRAVSVNKSISASPSPPEASSYIVAEVSVASTPGTPEVRDVAVTFPLGLSLSPSAADGLEGCSDAEFAKHSFGGATCPDGSQIGTVKITTPLLNKPLNGQVFLGTPECGDPTPCNVNDATEGRMFRLFIQAIDPENGVIVKVTGTTSVDPVTGQVSASFKENPQLPFEVLELKLKNGPRAPLATPQTCGSKITRSEFVPWSTGGLGGLSGNEQINGTPNATAEKVFTVDWDGKGGACPETLPFNPKFTAGTTSTQAAASGSNQLSVSMVREDREQDMGGITLHTPSGLLGSVSLVELCEEPQAVLGTCSADSRIGTVTAGAGPGSHPFFVKGSMYLTSSYKGAPFGLSIVVPTKAGPFNLGNVVVRATVSVDPHTAELTVVSDPLPQILDGIPLRLRNVNVAVDKEGFIQNPTSCAPETITATISGAAPREKLSEGVKTSNVSSPFDVGGCANVPFKPSFTASTQANLASRKNGASLHVDLSQKHGEANIHSVRVELPIQLPARLTTLQKACTEAQFAANPAGCPSASLVGSVVAHTPILPVPLSGPAYFVSHGGAKFPELILVLQGDGVTIELDGETFIDPKTNVTSSTFKTVPDAPVDSFELTLPTGPYSALAAPGGLQCGKSLLMPTVITGQNGMQIKQNTTIKTVGCTGTKKLTNAQKLTSALKACKKLKNKTKRASCEKKARKKYAKSAKKASKPKKG